MKPTDSAKDDEFQRVLKESKKTYKEEKTRKDDDVLRKVIEISVKDYEKQH